MFEKLKNFVSTDEFRSGLQDAAALAIVVLTTAVVVNGIVATGSYITDQVTGKPIGTTLIGKLQK